MRRSITAIALVAGLAMTSFIGLLGSGVSSAQTVCGYSATCTVPASTPTVPPVTPTTQPATTTTQGNSGAGGGVSQTTPSSQVAGTGASVAAPASSPSGALAFTGADIGLLLVLALVVIGGGSLLFRLSRSRKQA
jgi:hypothetical protein